MSGCYIMVDNIVIYYEHWIFKYWPMKNYTGITLTSNIILFKPKKENIGQRLMNHENAHRMQMLIYGEVMFYIIYLYNYIKNLFVYKSHRVAYKMIPFEIEARELSDV